MAVMTYIESIRDTLAGEMRRDESIVVLGEDVGKKGGVFLATDGLYDEFGGDRVLDTPLSESMIVGVSIGAGVAGLRPVPEIQFADFIFPAFNQIVSEAARMRYRSNNGYGVPMTIRAPYGGGVHGALYHSQSVEAFFTEVESAAGADRHLDDAVALVRKELAADPADLEVRARRVVEQLALVLQGSLLVRHAPAAVADAFCASRLGGDWGAVLGTLPASADVASLVRRATIATPV